MECLISRLQEQSQGQPQEGSGLTFDVIRDAWKQAGQPKTAEAIHDLLMKLMGNNKEQVTDAFKTIGINFEQVKGAGAAKVIDKATAKQIYKAAMKLSPDLIRQLIQVAQSGQYAGQQQAQQQKPQAGGANQQSSVAAAYKSSQQAGQRSSLASKMQQQKAQQGTRKSPGARFGQRAR